MTKENNQNYAQACLGLAELYETRDLQEAQSWVEKALARSANLYPSTSASLLIMHGTLQMHLGQFDAANVSFETGLALLPQEPSQIHGRAYLNMSGISFYRGLYEQGKAFARQALAISNELADIVQEAQILDNLAALKYVSGDWQGAVSDFQQALRLAGQLGNQSLVADIELNLGAAIINTGHTEKAQNHLRKALAIADEIGFELVTCITHMRLAELSCRLQELELASSHIRASEKIALALDAKPQLPGIYCTWVDISLAQQETFLAQDYAAKALKIAKLLNDPLEIGIALRAHAVANLSSMEQGIVKQKLRDSIQFLAELDPFETARSRSELGKLLLLTPQTYEQGLAEISEAKKTFDSLGAVPYQRIVDGLLEEFRHIQS